LTRTGAMPDPTQAPAPTTPTDPIAARRRAWRQLAISYLLTNGAVFALSRRAPMKYGLHELIGALFLVAGLWSIRRDDDDTQRFGVRLGGIFPGRAGDDRSLVRTVVESVPLALRELAVAAAVSLVVLPIYAYFWPLFNRAPAARHFLDSLHTQSILTNLLAVALTEELYFRGYVLTRVADGLGVPRDLPLGPRLRAMAVPIVVTAALFALTHVTVEVTLPRAVVFFPGLLFGVVRVWRGGIGAAVFLHAISNVFENWLEGQ
jgi:membrane protease YdiL (CAAX protease family)